MRAVCWYGRHDVRVCSVPDPELLNPHDAIVRVTATAICSGDLHLYNHRNPFMRPGDILGHECVGQVVEVGSAVETVRAGDRVVVPFPIACGQCWPCRQTAYAFCDNTNPNAALMEQHAGAATAGMFGCSHLTGGYAGSQAEFVRVPFADVGPLRVPDHLDDAQVVLLSDTLPTAAMAIESCDVRPGDHVAVWGCGAVGLLAVRCALRRGAASVLAIDHVPERLRMAAATSEAVLALDASTIDDVVATVRELTGGRGADACVYTAGGAHGTALPTATARAARALGRADGAPNGLRQALQACRPGGTVAAPGAAMGLAAQRDIAALLAKGLTLRCGPTHVHRYLVPLLREIDDGELDCRPIITDALPLEDAPAAYARFNEHASVKILLHPGH